MQDLISPILSLALANELTEMILCSAAGSECISLHLQPSHTDISLSITYSNLRLSLIYLVSFLLRRALPISAMSGLDVYSSHVQKFFSIRILITKLSKTFA